MPILLYDGDCGLCSRLVRFVHERDRHDAFRFAPLGGPTARALLRRHGLPEDLADTVVLVEDEMERAYTRSEAALRVGARLDGAWPAAAARLGALVPRALRDRAYDLVARHRHRVFHARACALPEPRLREKMLP